MPEQGEYVCVRSRDQGVVFGHYLGGFGRHAIIGEARQQHLWEQSALTLFDLVEVGPVKAKCRLSRTREKVEMTEVCGFIPVPLDMVEAFKKHPPHKV